MDLTIIKDVDGFVVGILEGHAVPSKEAQEVYDTYKTSLIHVTHNPELDLEMTLDNALDGGIGVLAELSM